MARLASDPDALAAFMEDPARATAGLPHDARHALMSSDVGWTHAYLRGGWP